MLKAVYWGLVMVVKFKLKNPPNFVFKQNEVSDFRALYNHGNAAMYLQNH